MSISSVLNLLKYKKYILYCIGFFLINVTECSQNTKANDNTGLIYGILNKISEKSGTISKKNKPFSEQAGYMEKIENFNMQISSIDNNVNYKLSELKNNVIILFFTTTWCPNCPSVFKDLDILQEKLNSLKITNVKIIPLIIEDNISDNGVSIYYKANNINSLQKYKSISPQTLKNIEGIPTCIIQDKKGQFVWGYVGIANYQSQEFLNYIIELSEEK